MSDYMRKIIYLRKWEGGIRTSSAGYIRLERKKDLLFISLRVLGEVPEGSPVYAIYRLEGAWKRLGLGALSHNEGKWCTQIALSDLPVRDCGDRISAVCIGNSEQFWIGKVTGEPLPDYELLNIFQIGRVQFPCLCDAGKKKCAKRRYCCCLMEKGRKYQ